MFEIENAQIDTSLSQDVGDETSNRYRYQWIISAIICCMLLDESEDVQEVFCEHHEDILLKHKNGLFTGIQIKTKADNQPSWNINDKDIINVFSKFVSLDNKYQNQFQSFKFITNHQIQSSMNGRDIIFVLKKIYESNDYNSLIDIAKSFIKKISKKEAVAEEKTFLSLKKASASHDFPKLKDASMRLINTILLVWDRAKEAVYDDVKRVSTNLVDECFRASSLASQDFLPAYLAISSSGEEKETQESIAGKIFNKQRVYDVLLQGLDKTIPLSSDPVDLEDMRTENTELLRKKLSAGGFSAVSAMYAEDLKGVAEYAGTVLVHKYGREQGLKKYQELRLKVQGEAARAFEKNKKDNKKFGIKMQSSLREDLTNRFSSGEEFYGCSVDHLEGIAYSLTSQCKVMWSADKPWETE